MAGAGSGSWVVAVGFWINATIEERRRAAAAQRCHLTELQQDDRDTVKMVETLEAVAARRRRRYLAWWTEIENRCGLKMSIFDVAQRDLE